MHAVGGHTTETPYTLRGNTDALPFRGRTGRELPRALAFRQDPLHVTHPIASRTNCKHGATPRRGVLIS